MGSSTPHTAHHWNSLAATKEECAVWLEEHLRRCDSIYESLAGPAAGFHAAMRETGCREEVYMSEAVAAAFIPYNLSLKKPENRIVYGHDSLQSLASLFFARSHEGVHAMQQTRSAAINMVGSADQGGLILCPRDFIRAVDLQEYDAYAKQGLLIAGWAEHSKEGLPSEIMLRARSVWDKISRAGHLDGGLRAYADSVMDKTDGEGFLFKKTIRDGYHRDSLMQMKAMRDLGVMEPPARLTFCRLGPEDILAIGENFGPNLFGRQGQIHPRFAKPPRLPAMLSLRIHFLNAALGIKDEEGLPSVSEALRGKGLSPADFLARARPAPDV